MVLGWRRPGRVGRCRIPIPDQRSLVGLFLFLLRHAFENMSFAGYMHSPASAQNGLHRTVFQRKTFCWAYECWLLSTKLTRNWFGRTQFAPTSSWACGQRNATLNSDGRTTLRRGNLCLPVFVEIVCECGKKKDLPSRGRQYACVSLMTIHGPRMQDF